MKKFSLILMTLIMFISINGYSELIKNLPTEYTGEYWIYAEKSKVTNKFVEKKEPVYLFTKFMDTVIFTNEKYTFQEVYNQEGSYVIIFYGDLDLIGISGKINENGYANVVVERKGVQTEYIVQIRTTVKNPKMLEY